MKPTAHRLCFLGLLLLGAPAWAVTWPLTSEWYGLDFKRANGNLGTGAGLFVFDQTYNVAGCPNGRQYFYTVHNDDGFQNRAVARLCNPQDQPGGFTRYTLFMVDGPTCMLDVYGAASGPQGGPAGYRLEWFNCSNGVVQSGAYLGGAALRASNSRAASQPGLECLSGAPGLGIGTCTASATGLQLARCVRDCAQRRFLGTGVPGSAPTNCRSHKWSNNVPGVVNPALCITNVKDQDRDHLIDQIEEDLAHRHAPLEMLTEPAGSENFPSSVEWYLRFASMVYRHDAPLLYISHPVQSTVRNDNSVFGIANQFHFASATDTGALVYSNRPTTGGSFHVGGCSSDTCKRGVVASNPWEVRTDWKIYANAYPGSDPYGTGILIQYWVFYPYNDTNSGGFDHEGDWEHMVVKVRADTSVPPGGYNGGQQYVAQGAYFKQHEDPYKWRYAQNLFWEPPTGPFLHPKVWVSEGSHASYPDQQSCQSGGGLGTDNCYTTSNNTRWYTWLGGTSGNCGYKGDCQGAGVFLMSSDTSNPTALSPQYWAAFSGKWGTSSGTFVGNPTGPAYKGTYNSYKADIYPLLPIW